MNKFRYVGDAARDLADMGRVEPGAIIEFDGQLSNVDFEAVVDAPPSRKRVADATDATS